jgi:hypothetical protein
MTRAPTQMTKEPGAIKGVLPVPRYAGHALPGDGSRHILIARGSELVRQPERIHGRTRSCDGKHDLSSSSNDISIEVPGHTPVVCGTRLKIGMIFPS